MGTRTRKASLKIAAALSLVVLWSVLPATAPGAPAPAAPIAPGFDLFHTDPASTEFDFSGPAEIPANFFGPNSDPFTGQVKFAGKPLETFNGFPVGNADTVVQRDASNPSPIQNDVPIEIVALSLVSMEPITVTYNGGQNPELWNVNAGLSSLFPQQPGVMHINMSLPDGGYFNSYLPVTPKLTFTRLSDGTTNVIDVNQPHPLQANNVPWRTGCQLPALHVPGLNDGFCPSYDGQKQLTVEDSLNVAHGIYPAQPALEHFKCYNLRPAAFQQILNVGLKDQFGTRQADITDRFDLCNPVRKYREPFRNGRAHLVCYETATPPLNLAVVVRNQFGSQRLQVLDAQRLCVPSQKRKPGHPFRPIQIPIDHFQCYNVQEITPLQRVGQLGKVPLQDQFGREKVRLGPAVRLCAPVEKNHLQIFPIQHPVAHLVCYQISDPSVDQTVYIRNQFERKKLKAKRPNMLCVPSAKVLVP